MSKEKSYKDEAKFGMIAFLAYIGAAWYFLDVSSGFWGSILALLQALIWPVYLVHRVFQLLQI